MISIYGLLNPIDNNIFYIGATKNPYRRLLQHNFIDYRKNKSYKETIILEIKNKGLKTEMIILEECLPQEVSLLENFYIDLFKFYGFKINQSQTSTYLHGGITPLRITKEKFKYIVRDNIVYCTMTFNTNGGCTDIKMEFETNSYTENSAKMEMRKYYYELKSTIPHE